MEIKIKALRGIFNGQAYFNAVVSVSLLKEMKEDELSPEDCNMLFVESDNYKWDKVSSTLVIKDLRELEYLLFTGDLDLANNGEELPFVICTKKQKDTLFYR